MSNLMRKSNAFLNILSLVICFGLFLFVVLFGRMFKGTYINILYYVLGVVLAVVINSFVHELGHYLSGKRNGFYLISFSVLFFRWTRINGKMRFSFSFFFEEAGKTVMVPKDNVNLENGIYKMAKGGINASFIMLIFGIIPIALTFIFPMHIPAVAYYITSCFLPIGAYYFFGNAMPIINAGTRNDGAVVSSFKRKDDASRVMVCLHAIYLQLFKGQTPKEIDEEIYLNMPQLPEDDSLFINVLTAKYAYYLDLQNYKEAKTVSDRLIGIMEYIPDSIKPEIKAEALFKACTYDYNEQEADDLMVELEKYLNNRTDAFSMRAKTAYLKNVLKDTETIADFYDKWERECEKQPLDGLIKYEKNLLKNFKSNF